MRVTRRAVDAIRFLEEPRGLAFEADLRQVKDARKAWDAWKADGASPKSRGWGRPGIGLLLEPKWVGEKGGSAVHVPVAADRRGVLRLTLEVASKSYCDGLPNPHLWVKVGGKVIDYREVIAPVDQPKKLTYEVQLDDLAVETKGVAIELSGRIEVPYEVKGVENEDKTKPEDKIPGGSGLFRPKYNRKAQPEEQLAPLVALQSIKIETDASAAWPPAEWKLDLGKLEDNQASFEKLLAVWIERAWRRPVAKQEQTRFVDLYAKLRQARRFF